ncbi:hypothetical protein EVAR_30560_1 [Eumeta japonica]|uniref:Uncharacterized protein n=1 Tax=Eumeta variegata TaxID=151549 RepID=A0A4C1VPA9_EUMVA|nr:hypothetical protein EVAR_30560_1 [Eumeta japonica]
MGANFPFRRNIGRFQLKIFGIPEKLCPEHAGTHYLDGKCFVSRARTPRESPPPARLPNCFVGCFRIDTGVISRQLKRGSACHSAHTIWAKTKQTEHVMPGELIFTEVDKLTTAQMEIVKFVQERVSRGVEGSREETITR